MIFCTRDYINWKEMNLKEKFSYWYHSKSYVKSSFQSTRYSVGSCINYISLLIETYLHFRLSKRALSFEINSQNTPSTWYSRRKVYLVLLSSTVSICSIPYGLRKVSVSNLFPQFPSHIWAHSMFWIQIIVV